MMLFYVLLLIVIAYFSMVIFAKLGWSVQNFEGKKVPYSLGIFILFSYSLFLLLFVEQTYIIAIWIYLLGIWFTGLLDDWFGTKTEKGLKGHLKAFIYKGIFSTGILKIFSTAIFTYYVLISIHVQTFAEWIRYGIILLLAPHIMNLFDTRPLRVWKVSLLYGCLFLPWLQIFPLSAYLYLMSFYFIFYVFEGHKIAMLGDNGATLIGAIFAIMTIMHASVAQQWGLIAIFFLLTIIAEKISFSRFIAKYPILKWIDEIGVHTSK